MLAGPIEVLCIGGVTVDRFYRLAGPLALETSNPAVGSVGVGGVAGNVARQVGRSGARAALLSCVGDDEDGRAVLALLDSAGIERRGVTVVPNAVTASYVAVLTPEGDLALGLAAMEIFDRLTPAVLADAGDLIGRAAWIFADCNLPGESLLALSRRRVSGTYRLAVDAVSVAKSARLPERLDGVDLLFLNRDEAAALAARHGRAGASPADVAGLLLGLGAGAVVLTLGREGALAATADKVILVPALPARVVNVTGAGDALVAAVIQAVAAGADLVAAVTSGCAAAARWIGEEPSRS